MRAEIIRCDTCTKIITDEKGRRSCDSTAMFKEIYEPIEQEERARMNKGEILVAIHNMRGEYAHKASEDLKRIGKTALGGTPIMPTSTLAVSYYESQAKVSVLDELLEKIDKTPDETKHNPFCNHSIYDSQGNEIARAKGGL